jgi:hypothetical protein
LLSTAAYAQNTTAVGTGISSAESNSGALAVANNRGNGNSSLTVVNPASTTSTATVNSNVSGSTTSRIVSSGSTTVRTAPSMVAPGLAAAGLETCLGSASGTVSAIGFGIGGGSTYVDPGCEARLDARTLASWGLRAAAVARICQQPKVWNSMPDVCQQYWPRGMPVPYGVVVVQPGYGANIQMSASGGSVESLRIVNGRTGIEGDCLNYSAVKQKCYQWAGEPRQRTAAVQPTKRIETPQRIVVKPKPAAMPVQTAKPPTEPPQVEPKAEDKKT